jgi:alpha-L-rhamnosidase
MSKLSLRASSVLVALFITSMDGPVPSGRLLAAGLPGTQPTALQADALTEPLGLDNPHPRLAWHLQDVRAGARQTAYEITVFSSRPGAPSARPDIWDSGRITSAVSTGIPYSEPDLLPEKRYFWRVVAWDANNKAYPASAVSWFETGLLQQTNWHAEWIGYEPDELHSIRESGATWITNVASADSELNDTHHDFRYHLLIDKPVQRAVLYTTGEDDDAAWINGQQVLQPKPLTPWKQMPWGTYERADVTSSIQQGENLLAIGITRYKIPKAPRVSTQAPMSAALFVASRDGSKKLFTSNDQGWKAQLDASGDWWMPAKKDNAWKAAEPYKPASDPFCSRDDGLPWSTGPVAALRKQFSPLAKTLRSERLYATALGAYKFRFNGAAVGDQVLSPGWMDFRKHISYQVYDATKQVHSGPNAIAAFLAPGWYSTPLRWLRQGNHYGTTQPALKAQLRLEYVDGSIEWIATDSTWKADTSPILFAEICEGETRDARREQAGWDTAGFNDAAWHPASVIASKEPLIVAQYFPPIREHSVLTAKKITEPKPGVYVLNFGHNISALPRLHISGRAGDDVQLRFAEVLNPDGTLYVDNLRTAKATDNFILAGSEKQSAGSEDFEPLFTFHGFRYAEITGVKTKPTLATLEAAVLHTDAPFTTRFSTGDSMINKLWSNVLWGQRSNFVGVPTDCPQRDERLGWSADAQVFWRTATFNMDLTTFSQKYAADLHGTQVGTGEYGIFAPGIDTPNPGYGAAWSDAGVIIPWTGWIQSGNPRIIKENWTGMETYLAEIERKNPGHLWQNGFGAAFGDWLTPTITTPEYLLATAYRAYDVTLMQQMALATGRIAQARHYEELFAVIKAAFQKAYVHSDGFVGTIDHFPSIPPPPVNPGDAEFSKTWTVETQTGYVLALSMHLMPDDLRAAAADKLVEMIRENHWLLGTRFLGTPYLLAVLSDTGHANVAFRILLNRAHPSWGYLIDHGATTTWERWNGDTMRDAPSMNSYNHYAYGAVAEWLDRYAAGVDTDPSDPGFHTITLHPNFDKRLGHPAFDYDSAYGTVRSAWTTSGETVLWKVIIPPNTSAILSMRNTNATDFTLNRVALTDSENQLKPGKLGGDIVLPAGAYSFNATLQQPSKVQEAVYAAH